MNDSGDNFSQEALRAAVASHYNGALKQRWHELASGGKLDWSQLHTIATAHGLSPMLYSAVESCSPVGLSEEVALALKRQYQLTATKNMLAMHDLGLILERLNEVAVPTILLKGAALLGDVYENQALRPMVDLDILIHFADLSRALPALESIGYVNNEPQPFPNSAGLFWNEILLHDDSRTSAQLELHWNLLDIPYYAYRLPVDSLMRRAVPRMVEGQRSLALCPEDLLLHLCAHNQFHHLGKLWRTEVDVAFVAERYGSNINWQHVVATARSSDLVQGIKRTLTRSANFWHAPIPPAVLSDINQLESRSRERFWLACQRSEFLKVLRTFITLPGIGQRWSFLRGQLAPSREYLNWRYDIAEATPGAVAYPKRYISGLKSLVAELTGRTP